MSIKSSRRCALTVVIFALFLACTPMWAAHATETSLLISPGLSVPSGTILTFTANVSSNGSPLSVGVVNFCDADASACSGHGLLGTAYVTTSGKATLKTALRLGATRVQAILQPTVAAGYATSSSPVYSVNVTGGTATVTISASGASGDYTLTGTVTSATLPVPTGNLVFRDTTSSNISLGSATLGAANVTIAFSQKTGASSGGTAIGDFDEDGIPDIAGLDGSEKGEIFVISGRGDGTFAAQPSFATSLTSVSGMAVGDFNRDGHLDIVATSVADKAYSILLGDGHGGFTVLGRYSASFSSKTLGQTVALAPSGVTVADFNGDGIADLLMQEDDSAEGYAIVVLTGNGNGTFAAAAATVADLAGEQSPFDLVVADFNGDGRPDVAWTQKNSVVISFGDLSNQQTVDCGASTEALASLRAGDFNRDGYVDLVAVSRTSQNAYILTNSNTGWFTSTSFSVDAPGNIAAAAVADFNGDGIDDLAAEADGQVMYLRGIGDATFVLDGTYSFASKGTVVAADLNLDGIPDLAQQDSVGEDVLLTTASSIATASISGVSIPAGETHDVLASYEGDGVYTAADSATTPLTSDSIVAPDGLSGKTAMRLLGGAQAMGTGTNPTVLEIPNIPSNFTYGNSAGLDWRLNTRLATAPTGTVRILSDGNEITTVNVSSFLRNSTNLMRYSENAAQWGKISGGTTGALVLANAAVGPTGTATASSFSWPAGSDWYLPANYLPFATTPGSYYTFSVWLRVPSGTLNTDLLFWASDMSASNANYPITITTTWQRFSTIALASYGTSIVGIGGYGTLQSAAGTIQIWGAQVEAGTTPGPYVATTSTGASGTGALGTAAFTGNVLPHLSAGTHSISITYDGDNYYAGSTSQALTITITKKALNVQAASKSRNYGAANPAFTPTYSGFASGDSAAVLSGAPSLTTTATATSFVGSYTISTAVGTLSSPNYTFTLYSGTLTINRAPLTITANDDSKTYGATKSYGPGSTAFTTSGLQNGETVGAVTLSSAGAVATAAAGTYFILPGGATGGTFISSNYSIAYYAGTLTVGKAVLTVTANDASRTYGATNPGFTASYSGFVNGDTTAILSGSPILGTTATSGSPAGTYAITVAQGSLSAANYSFAFVNGTLTVNKAVLTVTANNMAKGYGAAFGTFSASYSGFVNGDTQAVLSGSPNVTTAATTASPVGTYPITASQGTLTAASYSFSFVNGTLTITAAPITITANNDSKTYGQAKAYGSGSTAFVASGLQRGETVGTVTLSSAGAAATAAAGSYSIIPSAATGGTFTASNYQITYANGTLTVNKAVLTVTANSTSRVYGAANPGFTASYSGWQNGDTSSALSGSPSLTTTATAASPAGSYTITAATGTLAATNYTFTFVNGSLTINKAALMVIANDASRAYGAANPAFTYSISGFVNGDTQASATTGQPSLTTTATASSPVGSYSIVASAGTLASGNYNLNFTNGSLTIGKATLTVTANNATRAYGDANPVFSVTYSGFLNGDTQAVLSGSPNLTTTATSLSPAGTYAINVAAGTLTSANYAFTFVSGTLTVTKTPVGITITSSRNPSTFGDTVTFTISVTGNGAIPSGTVAVNNGATNLGPLSIDGSGKAHITLPALAAGSHVLGVKYNGDGNYR